MRLILLLLMSMHAGVMDSVYVGTLYIGKEYPDSALRRIFYRTKEFRVPCGPFTIC
jgi:hypothetical protein